MIAVMSRAEKPEDHLDFADSHDEGQQDPVLLLNQDLTLF